MWPYPRGDIWGKVINNLSLAGAKVIGFDIQFDAPDARSEFLRGVSDNWPSELRQFIPGHGDVILSDAIRDAQLKGTRVVMNTKMVREPLTTPPQYIANPVKLIMDAKPSTGLINDIKDIDNFSREYSIAGFFDNDIKKLDLPNVSKNSIGIFPSIKIGINSNVWKNSNEYEISDLLEKIDIG